MADKSGRPSFNYGNKPVPMKLFATWEVDKTPPYCIPRLCTMRLSRIILLKPLGNDVSSILIAVKMQSSKRVLRSNEIMLYPNGLLDTDLDLTFSLQYPHFLKRDGNKLQVMLQRRKRYKNRTILGYKTLAIGTINMSQVLQKPVDLELELITGEGTSSGKSDGNTSLTGAPIAPAVLSSGQVCARISVVSLSSQPVDQDSSGVPGSTRRKTRMFGDAAGSAGERDGDFSDDEDDFSSNEEGSDSEPMADEARVPARQIPRKSSRAAKSGLVRTSERQRNLKQKFVALLKRFKVSEDFQNVFATGASGIDENLQREMDPEDIEDWMDEFDDLGAASCESGNEEDEEDTLSISSTPKPSLRPFFSSRSLLHESLSPPGVTGGAERVSDESSKKGDSDSHQDHNTTTDAEHSDPQPPSANPQPSTAAHLTAASSSSPPKASSGDEMRGESRETKREAGKETKSSSGFSDILYGAKTLFPKDWSGPGSSSKEKKSGGGKERDRTCSSSLTGGPCLFSFPDFNAQPRKVLVEQLGRILPSGSDESPPSSLLIVSTLDPQGALVASLLNASSSHRPAICTAGHADVKATINGLVNRIQRYCNSNAKSPNPVKVVLVGSDSHVNAAVKPFVEQLSSRPPDWLSYIRFLIVPLGLNNLSRYISSIDNGYSNLFGFDGGWRDLLEKEELIRKADGHEILSRISRYLDSCSGSLLLPIAEAMIAYKEKSSDEGSSQIFIPFISEVRIAFPEPASSASVDLDENSAVNASSGAGGTGNSPSGLGAAAGSASNLGAVSGSSGGTSSIPCASSPPGGTGGVSGSPPNQFGGSFLEARTRLVGDTTPPNSPNVAGNHPPTYSQEPLDLQIDYWLSPGSTRSSAGAIGDRGERGAIDRSTDGGRSGITLTRGDSVVSGSLMGGDGEKQSKGSGKCSLRASFRSLVIQRRPQLGETSAGHHFTMTYSLKEKKQKYVIQRLGKKKSEKEKEAECKSITVEGINRLVCMARAQNSPLKVTIDGIEWSGVKFFQLSSQWQTHVKHFPIATVAPFTYVLSDR